GDTTKLVNGLCAGTHSVTVTDTNGCSDNMNVDITEPNALDAVITSKTDASGAGVCDGKAYADGTGGTPSYDFAWYDDTTTLSNL
ncbi:MAG: hypothetical protein ABEH43_06380, partial [Flavobacteriales bacterium]